jgi:predicted dehydrogenase
MPLALPDYLQKEGLRTAMLAMSKNSWEPSSLLSPFSLDKSSLSKKFDLRKPLSIRGISQDSKKTKIIIRFQPSHPTKRILRVGFIGLGMWARGNLIPFLLGDRRVRLVMGVDRDPIRLQQAADLFAIPMISTDPTELCQNEEVDAVFIATWHDAHAPLASLALNAGKKVFVEKPPVLDYGQLNLLVSSLEKFPEPYLAVGYNRVHSSLTSILRKKILATPGPVHITAIVRQPSLFPTHYYYWPHQGSRIVGNGCHWIDYAFHLLSPRLPEDLRVVPGAHGSRQDNMVIIMRYADGSLVTLVFSDRGESLIGGDEYLDIKLANAQYMIQDFKRCDCYQEGKTQLIWRSQADRGWKQEMREVVDGMMTGKPPREYAAIIASSVLMLEARLSLERGGTICQISPDPLMRLKGMSLHWENRGNGEGWREVKAL